MDISRLDPEAPGKLLALAGGRTAPELAAALIEAAARSDVAATGAAIIETVPSLTPAEIARRRNLNSPRHKDGSVQTLLYSPGANKPQTLGLGGAGGVQSGTAPKTQLSPEQQQMLDECQDELGVSYAEWDRKYGNLK